MKVMISDLKDGDSVDSLFSVKYKRAPTQYKSGWRFAFGASDKSGEIEVSYWGAADQARVRTGRRRSKLPERLYFHKAELLE